MAKTLRLFTKKEVKALRSPGWTSAQGWPLEEGAPQRRATCRCCGGSIDKGEVAMSIYLAVAPDQSVFEWKLFQDGRKCTRVWLHKDCKGKDW